MRSLSTTLTLALTLALAACTGTTTAPAPAGSASPAASPSPSATPHNTDKAETEACEHLSGGPAVAVTATADAAGAPEVKADHKRYDITLPAGQGGNRGSVRFNSTEQAEWSFVLNKAVPFMVRDAAGVAVPIVETQNRSSFCLDVKAHHIVLLGVGPAVIEFGPTTETSVGMVVEESHPKEGEHQD